MKALDRGEVTAAPLDAPTDLLSWYDAGDGFAFARHGRGVASNGSAVRITVPAGPDQVLRASALAAEALGRMGRPSDGPSPVIVGALPFDGMTPATLVIPRDAAVRLGGARMWRLRVDGGSGERRGSEGARAWSATPSLDDPPGPAGGPESFDLEPVPEPDAYVAAVTEARRRIRAGELSKVVLARMLVARADRDIDRVALLSRLRKREPDAYAFAVHGFVGATPELLVARWGREVWSNPLAGTAARSEDAAQDRAAAERLLGSRKDLLEHAPVVDAVRDALAPLCDHLQTDAGPSLLATGAVWHLSTSVRGILRGPAPPALELAGRLHPTPAVCGTPRDAAMAAIGELEAIDRTLYGGIVGWMDGDGNGEWAVALRCAEIQGRIALLFAGAGIVADSEPLAELAETGVKFRSMLGALGYERPAAPPPGPR
jgi:isochorismate synthase